MSGLAALSTLAGDWVLDRRIIHDTGDVHSFTGEARFTWSGPRLIEDQSGLLDLGDGAPLRATRRYVWTTEGGRIDVHFHDMRPFHTIPLRVVRPETTHLCPPDRYHVAYDFTEFPDWQADWHVEGPQKSYRMESRYSRNRDLP